MLKRTKKKRKIMDSFKDSARGVGTTIINEDNFKREVIIGIIALVLAFVFKVSRIEFVIIIIVIALVLSLELINTAIENTVDLCTKDYHPLAKVAKDSAAGALLIMCMFAIIVGILILGPKIIELLKGGI